MKRTIQALAMLIAITLVTVWMVGCGGEEEGTVAAVTKVDPAEGSPIAANQKITITFDNPATGVTVNGTAAIGGGTSWSFQGDLTGKTGIDIAWTSEDGSAGSKTVAYTIQAADKEPPKISSSTPKDGAKDLDPEKLNTDGMEITFSEPLKKVTVEVTIDGEPLKWVAELSDDKTKATVSMLKGGELPYESEVILVITAEDNAGNKLEKAEITFNTAAKEE
ncbi:hypothetical protein FJZ31_06805 [Candidatus Poribacteria bacterium]|nr:hypothetical protein [Candidatus Poribacteria bacterium]